MGHIRHNQFLLEIERIHSRGADLDNARDSWNEKEVVISLNSEIQNR